MHSNCFSRLVRRLWLFSVCAVWGLGTTAQGAAPSNAFVRVSPRDRWYFELSDGQPYIPIGLNMIAPPGRGLAGLERWMQALSDQGGNYMRVWLSNPFFDVESRRSGEYEADKAQRIEDLLALGQKYGIKIKFCMEHFRHLGEGSQTWAAKPLHKVANGGTATNMADFFNGQASRDRFKQKLDWYAQRFGNQPGVFGWELWNEINAVQGGDYMAWTEAMLPELHRRFPSNLCMQSLGSFDSTKWRPYYQRLAAMPGNDVVQVHRYLDLGASQEVCKGPMDVLAASATLEMRWAMQPPGAADDSWVTAAPGTVRPVLLAESGAVEPSHSGPFKLYAKDTNGMILHDVLFAPFFSGAAGPGHIWHWDAYVSKNNLWWHFGRFAEVVKGLDPPAELFRLGMTSKGSLEIRELIGKTTILAWCRDKQNTWRTELLEGRPPETIRSMEIKNHKYGQPGWKVRFYDPWENRWSDGDCQSRIYLTLPDFKRSLVVKYTKM